MSTPSTDRPADRLRLLPAVMIGAALLLTLKVTALVTGTSSLVPVVEAASSEPEEESSEEAPQAAAEEDENARPAVNLAARPAPTTGQSNDVLEALAARRKALDARENEIEMQEKLLAAAEARIDDKIVELKELKAKIDKVFKTEESKGDEKFKSLVKVYENMKPKDAAAVFEQLDMTVLLELLDRMNERKLAAILAAMDPARAQAVTVALATENEDRLSAVPTPAAPAPLGLEELEPILPGNAG
ncbi:MAG: MotE family protein [Candidatus Phaeomarinobacter sp.]